MSLKRKNSQQNLHHFVYRRARETIKPTRTARNDAGEALFMIYTCPMARTVYLQLLSNDWREVSQGS
jgi:hypothetical protein